MCFTSCKNRARNMKKKPFSNDLKAKVSALSIIVLFILSLMTVFIAISPEKANATPTLDVHFNAVLVQDVDNDGAIWDAYTNQSNNFMRLGVDEDPAFASPTYYWDNTSSDGGAYGYRYHFQEVALSNGFTENCTVYFNFTAFNSTNPIYFNDTALDNVSLWSPEVTLNTPADSSSSHDYYANLSIDANVTNGGNFTVEFCEGDYFSQISSLFTTGGTNGTYFYNWSGFASGLHEWSVGITTNNTEISGIRTIGTRVAWTNFYKPWGENNWTFTFTNNAPTFGAIYPTNGSIGVSISLTALEIDLFDPDGDLMDWSIEASTGANNNSNNVANGTRTLDFIPSAYNTTYYWWVNVTDGFSWKNGTYHFTTETSPFPVQASPSPANNSINQSLSFAWSINISDPDGDLFNWTIECETQDNNANATTNGTKTITLSSLDYSTNYTVYVNVTDGTYWTNRTYNFQTGANNPVVHGTRTPANGSTGVSISLASLSISLTDTQGDLISWTIECSNGDTDSGLGEANGIKTLTISGLAYSTLYTWWVNATDGIVWTNRTYHFTTGSASSTGGGITFGTLKFNLKGEDADIKIYQGTTLLYARSMVKDTSYSWSGLVSGTYEIRAEGITSGTIKEQTVIVTGGKITETTINMKSTNIPGFEIIAFICAIGIVIIGVRKWKRKE
jgi:hypothetical protein